MTLVFPGKELAEAGGLHEPTSPGSCMRGSNKVFLHCIIHVVDIHALNTHSATTTQQQQQQQQQQQHKAHAGLLTFVLAIFCCAFMWTQFNGEHVTGSAKRRRERRLRQWLRHERMTVAMALAEMSAPRRPTGTEHGQGRGRSARRNYTGHAPGDAPPRAASTLYFSLDDDVGVLGSMRSGHRNGFCGAPWSRTSASSRIRFSMFLRRRWKTNWWKCAGSSILTCPSRLSPCPRSLWDRVPQRSVCRRSRRADRLVEVPTIVSHSSLQQRTAKLTVDIPDPHGRGDRGGGERGRVYGSRPGTEFNGACGAER